MYNIGDKVFILAGGNPAAGVIVSTEYYGDFLEKAFVNVQGTVYSVERHGFICPFPVVGMGATGGYGSDCYPYTVVSVSKSGRQIELQRDEATYHGPPRKYGDTTKESDWTYTPLLQSNKYTVKLNKRGQWKGAGYVSLGHRKYYQDPSF